MHNQSQSPYWIPIPCIQVLRIRIDVFQWVFVCCLFFLCLASMYYMDLGLWSILLSFFLNDIYYNVWVTKVFLPWNWGQLQEISLNCLSNFLFSNFSCRQRPVVYQLMKTLCSCLWLQNNLWVPFQFSQGRLFYSYTGTNPPMWFILICVNDIDFFIIFWLFSSHDTVSSSKRSKMYAIVGELVRE